MSLAASPMSQCTDYLLFFRRYGSYAAPPAQGYGQTAQVRSESSLTIKTKFLNVITGFKSERVLRVWSVTCSLFISRATLSRTTLRTPRLSPLPPTLLTPRQPPLLEDTRSSSTQPRTDSPPHQVRPKRINIQHRVCF